MSLPARHVEYLKTGLLLWLEEKQSSSKKTIDEKRNQLPNQVLLFIDFSRCHQLIFEHWVFESAQLRQKPHFIGLHFNHLANGTSFDPKGKINRIVRFYFQHALYTSILTFLFVMAIGCRHPDTSDSWDETLNKQLRRDTSTMRIDTGFCNFMRKYHLPAISVAIAKDNRLVYRKSFGLVNLSDGIEADSQSLFRIVESSMAITSIAIKKLIAEGRLNFNSKVFGNGGILGNQYGRNQYGPWITDLTIENLLKNQVAGWYGADDMIADVEFRQLFASKDSAISWVLDNVPLKSVAGDSCHFSEFDYFILGRVIEKVSGRSFENYIKENILRPAEITDMEMGWDSARRPHEVSYYFPSPNSIRDFLQPRFNGEVHENMYLSRGDAALGWIASAADIVKLMMKYKTFESLDAHISVSRATSLTDTAKAKNGCNFDWCSSDSIGDWWESFQLLGSSTIMMRSSDGFCCAILINTFRPGSPKFFTDVFQIIKRAHSDPAMQLLAK